MSMAPLGAWATCDQIEDNNKQCKKQQQQTLTTSKIFGKVCFDQNFVSYQNYSVRNKGFRATYIPPHTAPFVSY